MKKIKKKVACFNSLITNTRKQTHNFKLEYKDKTEEHEDEDINLPIFKPLVTKCVTFAREKHTNLISTTFTNMLTLNLYNVDTKTDDFSRQQKEKLKPRIVGKKHNCCYYPFHQNTIFSLSLLLFLLNILVIVNLNNLVFVNSYQITNNLIANNSPPKFVTQTGDASSEIVVRVKEGPASVNKLICQLKAEDDDDDELRFGALGSIASDLLRIESVSKNEANVYLRKELDRESTESYQVVITLTDDKLGRSSWVSYCSDEYIKALSSQTSKLTTIYPYIQTNQR